MMFAKQKLRAELPSLGKNFLPSFSAGARFVAKRCRFNVTISAR